MNRLLRIFTRLIRTRFVAPLATLGIGKDRPQGNFVFDDFIAQCQAMNHPRVLELGTKRSIASRSTRRDSWIPHAREYLGTDIESGVDVDIIADAHRLTDFIGEEQFDIIISCSTFEHFKYPHRVAHEIMKALRVGGLVFIQTHQSFPLHSYPYDYFRFSREALAGLFGTQMGFKVRATDYYYPVKLYSPHDPGAENHPAFLNVRLFGEKVAKTPLTYIYEYDTSIA